MVVVPNQWVCVCVYVYICVFVSACEHACRRKQPTWKLSKPLPPFPYLKKIAIFMERYNLFLYSKLIISLFIKKNCLIYVVNQHSCKIWIVQNNKPSIRNLWLHVNSLSPIHLLTFHFGRLRIHISFLSRFDIIGRQILSITIHLSLNDVRFIFSSLRIMLHRPRVVYSHEMFSPLCYSLRMCFIYIIVGYFSIRSSGCLH